jgi:Ca2+-binding EF-hand superfamily protein
LITQGLRAKRTDSTAAAESLFSKLDTSSQGYIQKTDLQAAFDKISSLSSSTSSSSASTSVDELFAQLDSDSDGKVTKQEFSDTLAKLSEELDNQFMSARMAGGTSGAGAPPPPPPPGGNDAGFTKDELNSQISEVGSSDSKLSSLISDVVANFDEADTDGDGKVSFKETMAYEQSKSNTSATSTTDTSATTASTSSTDISAKVASQILRLMQAYGSEQNSGLLSTLSVTA